MNILFDINGKKENICCSGRELYITDKHYCIGDTLAWEYNEGDSFEVCTPLITIPDGESPFGINCRIYSECADERVLKFEFGTDGKENLSFLYTLNFVGWKEISLTYERGFMKGAYSDKMNYFRVSAHKGNGTVYFSDICLCRIMIPNHLYTKMAPQVKNLPLPTRRGAVAPYESYGLHLAKPVFALESITPEVVAGFESVTQKYIEIINETDNPPFVRGNFEHEKAIEIYESHNINYDGTTVTGKFINKSAQYAKAMKTFATEFYETGDAEAAERFILMWRHLKDQNTKISWYNGRGVGSGLLLMKGELAGRGLLDEAVAYLKSAYDFNRIYIVASDDMATYARFEDTDTIGMDLPSTLACILLMEDSPEKLRDMRHFVYYVENFCLGYAPGLRSGYKPDGTAFHHCGYIRQYQTVANYSLSRVVYMLSKSPFMIDDEATRRFKYILETEFIMYNGVYEPFTICQYAFDSKRDTSVVEFAHMANALDDKALAGMYVTLAGCSQKEQQNPNYQKFMESGIEPINSITEHKTLTYSAAAFHCRNNWKVALRGHSKYVYPMEIWPDETGEGARPGMRYTAFSLYRSFGFLELMYPPEFEGGTNNGIEIEKGFDFCRWPGTTSVHVPLNQIKSVPQMVEDEKSEWLLSDTAFVGGLDSHDKNGVFAMQLHGPAKYGLDSFYADKSYHFYEDMVVCMGSGISSNIEEYETETTLFQDYGTGAERNGNILCDNRGNGYYVFDGGENIVFKTENCTSRDVKDRVDTEGVRTCALINHKSAPEDAHYGYLMKVGSAIGIEDEELFGKSIVISKHDTDAHIVKLFDKTSYVFFKKAFELDDKWIESVSRSCIASVGEKENGIYLSVCDPDLRFYLGESEDYDLNRNKCEKSVYGRFWGSQDSMASRIWVVVKRRIDDFEVINGNAKIIRKYNDRTILEFVCKDGLTNEIVFKNN